MTKGRFRFGVDGFVSVKKTLFGFWKITVKEPIHFTLVAVDLDSAVNRALAAGLMPLNGLPVVSGDVEGKIFAAIEEVQS